MRAVLRQILETGDVVGTDTSGRVVITLAVDAWLLNKLAAFDGEAEDLEAEEGLGALIPRRRRRSGGRAHSR